MNDSFIETPNDKAKSKDQENNQNVINNKSETVFNKNNLPMILEKGESSAESFGKRDSTSRQLNFDDSHTENINKKEPDRPKIALFSRIQSNEASKKSSQAVISDTSWRPKAVDTKSVDCLSAQFDAMSVQRTSSAPEHKLCTELETPKVKLSTTTDDSGVSTQRSEGDEETPYKTFQIPPTTTMRRLQSNSQHRTLLSSANQPRKCRSDLENEFKSQKVLFTTPSAVTRPAIKVMSHLGLDDSLNCYKSSPMVNLSPVKEERQKNINFTSIEPIDGDHRSADRIDGKSCAKDGIARDDVAKDVNSQDSTKSSCAASDENEEKKKAITINGKDFVIQNKIGQGGSSSVFLVEHKDTKLQCALKV